MIAKELSCISVALVGLVLPGLPATVLATNTPPPVEIRLLRHQLNTMFQTMPGLKEELQARVKSSHGFKATPAQIKTLAAVALFRELSDTDPITTQVAEVAELKRSTVENHVATLAKNKLLSREKTARSGPFLPMQPIKVVEGVVQGLGAAFREALVTESTRALVAHANRDREPRLKKAIRGLLEGSVPAGAELVLPAIQRLEQHNIAHEGAIGWVVRALLAPTSLSKNEVNSTIAALEQAKLVEKIAPSPGSKARPVTRYKVASRGRRLMNGLGLGSYKLRVNEVTTPRPKGGKHR